MRFAKPGLIAAALIATTLAATAEEKITVQSLLGQGFQVVGATAPREGAGLFLQSKDKLFFCFIAETPTSVDVATRYCKPVR